MARVIKPGSNMNESDTMDRWQRIREIDRSRMSDKLEAYHDEQNQRLKENENQKKLAHRQYWQEVLIDQKNIEVAVNKLQAKINKLLDAEYKNPDLAKLGLQVRGELDIRLEHT